MIDLISESKFYEEPESSYFDRYLYFCFYNHYNLLFSDSELDMEPNHDSFINLQFRKRELQKMKLIKSKILEQVQKVGKPPKRKSVKLPKSNSNLKESSLMTNDSIQIDDSVSTS